MSLIAAYSFDEGAGATAASAVGGAAISVPAWGAGRHGSAMQLSGGGASVGTSFTPWATDTAFTIMFDLFLIGPGGNGSYHVILNDWENQGDSAFGNVQIGPGGTLDWYLGADTSLPVPNGEWKHIALTADGVTRRSYVDAVLGGSSGNANRSGTGPLVIGGFGAYTPNCRYDNLRIFDTALTQPEIAALAGTAVASGPAAPAPTWWDGAARQPATLRGWWDGAAIQPASFREDLTP